MKPCTWNRGPMCAWAEAEVLEPSNIALGDLIVDPNTLTCYWREIVRDKEGGARIHSDQMRLVKTEWMTKRVTTMHPPMWVDAEEDA